MDKHQPVLLSINREGRTARLRFRRNGQLYDIDMMVDWSSDVEQWKRDLGV